MNSEIGFFQSKFGYIKLNIGLDKPNAEFLDELYKKYVFLTRFSEKKL